MIKTFKTSCRRRSFVSRERLDKLSSEKPSIYHFSISITRVYAQSVDFDNRSSCIKVLIFYLAHITSVHGVSPFSTEFFYIELVCSFPDFFIRVESHSYSPVFYLRMLDKVFCGCHDFCYSRLVISSEKARSIRGN